MNIRITTALHELLRQTAEHTTLEVSEIIRRTANGIRNNRAVVHFELPEMYHAKPETVLKVRGLTMPEIQPDEFRKLLAMRCLEELLKPVSRKRIKDEPAKAGYILEEFSPE